MMSASHSARVVRLKPNFASMPERMQVRERQSDRARDDRHRNEQCQVLHNGPIPSDPVHATSARQAATSGPIHDGGLDQRLGTPKRVRCDRVVGDLLVRGSPMRSANATAAPHRDGRRRARVPASEPEPQCQRDRERDGRRR
jgi:hypothetical protein